MSQLNPSEISSVLKEKIAGLDLSAERKNEGIIVSVSDGIVRIHGMGDVMFGELIEFENGVLGLALNLEQDSVGAVVLGDYLGLIEGQKATCTGRILEVPVGSEMLGAIRFVDVSGRGLEPGKTRMTSGSARKKARIAVAKVKSIFGIIWTCCNPGWVISTGSSAVQIFLSG